MKLPEQVNNYLHPDSPMVDAGFGLMEASGGAALGGHAIEALATHAPAVEFTLQSVMELGGNTTAVIAGAALAAHGIYRVVRGGRNMRGDN